MSKKIPQIVQESICNDYLNTNLSEKEIGAKYRVSQSYVFNTCRRNKLETRPRIVSEGHKLSRIKFDENYFSEIDTANKSYFLGFISGDGHLSKSTNVVSILLNIKDKIVLEKFKTELKSEHNIYDKTIYDNRTLKNYYQCYIEICRLKFYKDIEKYGITTNKSKDLRVPTNIQENLISHYIRGVVDSDGCWGLCNTVIRLSIYSSSYEFLEDIQNILITKCELNKTKLTPNHNKSMYIMTYVGKQCEKIYNYLYSDGGFWLNRKYNVPTKYFSINPVIDGEIL